MHSAWYSHGARENGVATGTSIGSTTTGHNVATECSHNTPSPAASNAHPKNRTTDPGMKTKMRNVEANLINDSASANVTGVTSSVAPAPGSKAAVDMVARMATCSMP